MTEAGKHFSGNAFTPYLSKLGLHTEPFSNDVQDEFFLPDPPRIQRLNMLYHLAQNSDLLLIVTGERGSGKTSLLQHFIDMGDETWRSCVIDANAMLNPEQLLIQIAEGFGLPQDSVNFGSGLEMLKKRLVEMKRSELISLLIIDDAHELPAASLTMLMKLSELSDANEGLLRIVLFSEPRLIELLNATAFKDVRYRVTHTLEMPALNEQDTIHYIQHRLAIAGLKDDSAFSKAQLKKIYRLSGGVPGKINLHAHEMLLGKQARTAVTATAGNSRRLRSAMMILVILVITAGITWFFSRDALMNLSSHLASSDGPQADSVTRAEQTTRSLPLLPAKPLRSTVKEPRDNSKVAADTSPVDSTTNPVNAYALPKPDIQTRPVTEIDAPRPPVPQPATPTPAPAAPTGKDEPAKRAAAPVPAKTDTPASKPAPVADKPEVRDWLSRQNPRHFTLQLMGSHERRSINLVMSSHRLSPEQAAILHTQLNNKDWYILVYGSYSTRDQARAAISSLPKGLQLTKPWPRLIGDIQLLE
ncbi:AAA family ATPase [Sulfuriflexus sp.]|uniref:AAA family ATPase n=1 Tax=Sulfuriflexus sp. TaxID=2015443 RepID=UPI0028CC1087|nr:AAA family ATPase [Sulfuriflexus sp.]MDT8403156.1 AAA family ATPase [Sulfuriflexus sp.]